MKPAKSHEYRVRRLDRTAFGRDWNASPWSNVPALTVAEFHADSTAHRPLTEAKLAYDDRGLQLFFRVQDRFVRAVNTRLHGPVCKDSCVEFFFEPEGRPGYFNLEINCAGTPLMFFVRYPTTAGGARQVTPLSPSQMEQVSIRASLPKFIPIEIRKPLTWWVQATIPFAVLADFLGPLGELEGRTWRANFYKIASHTSQPHWGCWSPIKKVLSFHQPRYFAPIRFAPGPTSIPTSKNRGNGGLSAKQRKGA